MNRRDSFFAHHGGSISRSTHSISLERRTLFSFIIYARGNNFSTYVHKYCPVNLLSSLEPRELRDDGSETENGGKREERIFLSASM